MSSCEARAERLRRVNHYKAVQAELARQKEEADFIARREQRARACREDEALAAELAEQQAKITKDEKMLLFVRDFPEVRNLEHKLKDAYLKKARAEQVIDSNTAREQEVEEQRKYLQVLNEECKQAEALEEKKRLREIQRFREHQEAQLNLIREHQQAALEEVSERLRERIAVDAVVARVNEKEFLNALERKEKQRKLQEEKDEFYRIRMALKKAEQEREAKEEAAILAYLAEQNRRKEADGKTFRERNQVRANILEEQGRFIIEEQRKKEELEELLYNYYKEEHIAKEQALLKAEKESRERMSAAIAHENIDLIEQHRKAREKEQAEEMAYRQRLMEELAANAKLDQLNKRLQFQRKKEIIAESQRQMEARQKLKDEERKIEEQVDKLERKREEEIQEYIRRARAQLLEEHMSKLGRFAPIRYLKPDEKEKYLPQMNSLSETS
ncbi:unnamed protein product [Phytomonas sp. Hart1]|nr:unnamed protein product [Phytomonas sp. Hart1]|eukprot:CCW68163.1 unnamed protein product [Phytomonas sp. isolate Hart1]